MFGRWSKPICGGGHGPPGPYGSYGPDRSDLLVMVINLRISIFKFSRRYAYLIEIAKNY